MCDQPRFFAGAARALEGRATAEYMRGFGSSIRREPIGVIGSVAPWNYPMMMAVWKFAPALAAGNTIVLKPSDTTPASTPYMAELFADILPPGVFNVVCGDRDTGTKVVRISAAAGEGAKPMPRASRAPVEEALPEATADRRRRGPGVPDSRLSGRLPGRRVAEE
jgi:betaine-aldehyde dehydrogenase